MVMRSLYYLIGASVISAALFAADTLTVFFNHPQLLSVTQGNILTRVQSINGKTFNISSGGRIILPASAFIPPSFSKCAIIAEERAFFPYANFRGNRRAFYNQLFKYSLFTGAQYYSKSDAKIRTYIIDSTRIASIDNPLILPDPVYSSIETKRILFFKVHDNRLGEIVFKSEVSVQGNVFVVSNTNANTISKWGIPIAEPGDYRIIAVYVYHEEKKGFYYYCVHAINPQATLILPNAAFNPESFANRIRAETVKRASLLGLDWSAKLRP